MVTSQNVQSKLPADERRAVTVEAVIALAGSQNPSDITTAAIAKHMNLTQGALFRHFPSKDSIWQSVMEWVADRLLARIDSAAEGTSSPLSAMQAMFMSHIDFVVEHPGVPRMMFGQLQSTEETAAKKMAQTLIQRYSERIRARIEEGKAIGFESWPIEKLLNMPCEEKRRFIPTVFEEKNLETFIKIRESL